MRVQQLIDSREKGEVPSKQEKAKRLAPVVDRMEALKKGIGETTSEKAPKKLRKSA